jgi:hypothetical protein
MMGNRNGENLKWQNLVYNVWGEIMDLQKKEGPRGGMQGKKR